MQEEIGFEVATDGEFRRGCYWGRFVERTAGLEVRPALIKRVVKMTLREKPPEAAYPCR
jgi:methionine synthase II (cobalamin-independent)